MNTIYHEKMCPICYEDYDHEQENKCLLLNCGHIFHKACLEGWFDNNSTSEKRCLMCNTVLIYPNARQSLEHMRQAEEQKQHTEERKWVEAKAYSIFILTSAIFCLLPDTETPKPKMQPGLVPQVHVNVTGLLKLGSLIASIYSLGTLLSNSKGTVRTVEEKERTVKEIDYRPPIDWSIGGIAKKMFSKLN